MRSHDVVFLARVPPARVVKGVLALVVVVHLDEIVDVEESLDELVEVGVANDRRHELAANEVAQVLDRLQEVELRGLALAGLLDSIVDAVRHVGHELHTCLRSAFERAQLVEPRPWRVGWRIRSFLCKCAAKLEAFCDHAERESEAEREWQRESARERMKDS